MIDRPAREAQPKYYWSHSYDGRPRFFWEDIEVPKKNFAPTRTQMAARILGREADARSVTLVFPATLPTSLLVYWLCFHTPEGVCVVLLSAPSLIQARMAVALQGLEPREFTEGHFLDAKMQKRVPKKMVGRCLSPDEVQRLLKRLEHRS